MFFARTFCLSLTLSIVCAAAAFVFLVQIRPSDPAKYRKLVQESAYLHSRHALERHPAHQMRQGVQKDIWAMKAGTRLHCCLQSAYSDLTLRQKKDKLEASEELQHIQGFLQEGVDPISSMQQVRTFTSVEGTYHYPSHHFIAHDVHIHFYRLPGFELPMTLTQETPFLSAIARQACFSATQNAPQFTAYDITAFLDPQPMSAQ